MSGSNGLHPVINMQERQKCPLHPSKRKYSLVADAKAAAKKSAQSSGLDIAPYLCEGCGHYHLTKSTGGDTVQMPDGRFSVGEFKAMAPNHPVFSGNPAEEPPIVPGDHETRVRFARRFLEQNPEPTSEELCMALGGCTKDMLRKVMRDLGYRNTRGRHARWVKDDRETPIDVPVIDRATGEPVPDPEPDVEVRLRSKGDSEEPAKPEVHWIGGREVPWKVARVIENTERIRHIAVGDLLDTYAAAGYRLVLHLEDA